MNSYSADDISKAEGLQFLAYTSVSMTTFWIYDYVCSLHEEWTFLRLSRWTKVKGLYIITRYIPFLVLIADLYLYFAPNETPDRCRMVISIYACLTVISVLCSELFFVLRTYALWNNNQIVLTAILSTLFAVAVASLIADVLSVGNSHVTISMIPTITGCYRTSHGFQGSIPFLLLFAFQLGLVSLTIIRAVQNWRVFNSPLYEVVVKHNLFYYTCGLLLSAINVLMQTLFSQTAYRLVGEVLQYFVLAILATRMHRNLWQIDRQARDSVTDAYSTS
ncbi:hypothetical protein P692DRAFT_201482701 [Suillus brevipes Sb2]|nr:hypothetical protein P692DRAFT_201482701 [Suillus brevipes Sb2]